MKTATVSGLFLLAYRSLGEPGTGSAGFSAVGCHMDKMAASDGTMHHLWGSKQVCPPRTLIVWRVVVFLGPHHGGRSTQSLAVLADKIKAGIRICRENEENITTPARAWLGKSSPVYVMLRWG